jgi:hypothetical protein
MKHNLPRIVESIDAVRIGKVFEELTIRAPEVMGL